MAMLLQPSEVNSEKTSGQKDLCFHCGTPCRDSVFRQEEKRFCCQGCLTVFELLTENNLTDFYNLTENAGVRIKTTTSREQYAYLDAPSVRQRLVNYSDDKITRVTFHLPVIHCIACVWLLENLFRFKAGIGPSKINFPRKEINLSFLNDQVKLSEVANLLASLGYEPDLKLSDLDDQKAPVSRRLWLQLGVAGFAFGNIMLFSISSYLGLDVAPFKKLFGWLSLILSLPVFFYSAADYWKSAWNGLQRKLLTIDVPIAAGILALFGRSVYEVTSGHGEGYFDSLCGLIFFLLCGKLFQQKTYDRLSFERDYRSFFPLSVSRLNKTSAAEERVSLSQLQVGDTLLIRNGELIPADSHLREGCALIDYSFVTGESQPVERYAGDYLFAGGRQVGSAIEIEIVKAVSQSYLTSLWNQDAFRKDNSENIDTLTNVYSYRFTKIILAMAFAAALYWSLVDSTLAVKAFASILIVACPCALALAAPFALGTARRVLARRNIFLKNTGVLEALAKVDHVVFDKTGTLTAAGAGAIQFHGAPLTASEETIILSACRQSTHPNSVRIAEHLSESSAIDVRSFNELAGCGIECVIDGNDIRIGAKNWLKTCGIPLSTEIPEHGSEVHVAINGQYRGFFLLVGAVRAQAKTVVQSLSENYELTLLSGDNAQERSIFNQIFGDNTALHFNQNPQQKLNFVSHLQNNGRSVMMVGDGLNDAGALKCADVGVAVVESVNAFSPASDIIISSSMIPRLDALLKYSQSVVRVVRLSFLISTLYNVVGVTFAATGKLSPIVCAILMPLSSVTVVAFASGTTHWMGQRFFRKEHEQVNSWKDFANLRQAPSDASVLNAPAVENQLN